MANTEQVNLFSVIREISEGRTIGRNAAPSVHRFQITDQFFTAQRLANLEITESRYPVPPVLDVSLTGAIVSKFGTFKNAIRRAPRYTEPALRPEPTIIDDMGDRVAVIEDEEDF